MAAALVAIPLHASAAPVAGERFILKLSYETSGETSDGGSSSSSGQDSLLEEVIAVTSGGVELRYDLPPDVEKDEWMLPVRILRPTSGPPQLLNELDLNKRLEAWLKRAKFDRSMCGRWIFTWNAFQIDCDPKSAIAMVDSFDLRAIDLGDGAALKDDYARQPTPLVRAGTRTWTATFPVDPEKVRVNELKTSAVVAEILKDDGLQEKQRREIAASQIGGTVVITLETNDDGDVIKRVRRSEIRLVKPSGASELRTSTETLDRTPL